MNRISTFALLAAASPAASAQSTATLYGVVDVNVRAVNNGSGTLKSVSNAGLNTSRLGFRGVEDLGGGLHSGLSLETGLNPDTGTTSDSTRFWNRRSTVSLISSTAGELRLGRDFTPTYKRIHELRHLWGLLDSIVVRIAPNRHHSCAEL